MKKLLFALILLFIFTPYIFSQHTCYKFFGKKYLVIENSCCGYMYHNQTQIKDGKTNILVNEIHHIGTGKRQPYDATQALFLFMNKEETDMYIIMLSTEAEAETLWEEIASRQ